MEPNKKTDPEGNGEFDSKVTLKYKEDTFDFDLSNPEQRQRVIDLAQKGYGADQKWQEVAAQIKILDGWNKRLEAAKDDDSAFESLIADLEKAIGRQLTKKEEKNLQEEDSDFTDPQLKSLMTTIQDQNKKIQDLENRISENDVETLADKIESANEKLAKKWSADDDPKYDKEKVLAFAGEHGLLIKGDISEGLELAYKMLNFEELTKKAQNSVKKSYDKAQGDLHLFHTESDSEPGKLKTDRKTYKNYDEIAQDVLDDLKKEGRTLIK